jgi:hypothetical protein
MVVASAAGCDSRRVVAAPARVKIGFRSEEVAG